MRPIAAILVGLLALLVGGAPASAADDGQLTWAVAPADNGMGDARPNFGYEVEPGDTIDDAVVVTNMTAAPLTLAVYAADAFTTSSGQLDLLPAGEPSSDVGAWVRLEKDEVTLDAGEVATVPFTVTVPDDATPGDHSGGIVTSFRSTQGGSTVALDSRLGSRMHVRVAGELAPAVDAADVRVDYHPSWNPFAAGSATVTYVLRNTGNTRAAATDSASVAGPLGLLAAGSAQQDTPELTARSEIERQIEVAGVWPTFRLSASVEVLPESVGVGGATLPTLTVEGSAWAVPWSLLVLVVLVVAAAVVVPTARDRRRRRAAPVEVPVDAIG
ncbi:WxL protein peptidoglycan domain-containing protein [Cellulomonas sp. PhB150]|uniref:WxL protein peptidoglycan domain-containing protein n=1 Tax=Cellulomonas sp. PhB150 TaxID=2485188 RepID=UPI000FB7CEB8|nr:DUF916 domain-containing protein [Cellulomonas sp. PhB150]ROS23156.1 uncharacterized protein DUF916 [Cellulomonas sp. PhB150]